MNFLVVRSFDRAGYYYETRLLLAVMGLAVAGFFALRRGDSRYLLMFLAGSLFQGLMEGILFAVGLRGATYSLDLFGKAIPTLEALVVQGFAEGGILSLMSFWFADLVMAERSFRNRWSPYLSMCVVIVGLAFLVGWWARNEPVTSRRPMFAVVPIAIVTSAIALALGLVWWKGDGFRFLGCFYLGCVVYLCLTFEPMQIMGARLIAVRQVDGSEVIASFPFQVGLMAWSHLFEAAGYKMHYFAIPYALGLLSRSRT